MGLAEVAITLAKLRDMLLGPQALGGYRHVTCIPPSGWWIIFTVQTAAVCGGGRVVQCCGRWMDHGRRGTSVINKATTEKNRQQHVQQTEG